MRTRWLSMLLVAALGCDDPEARGRPDAAATPDADMPDAVVADARPTPDAHVEAPDLMARLPGLWSGPATDTPLGRFALLNMDVRAADDRQLFARFDLDAENNLRFAFAVETVDGEPTLVYRNGGNFQGLLRDTRAVLVESGPDHWRFCHGPRGCDFLMATFTFDGADRLTLEVLVRGMVHLRWPARRLERRSLPAAFAATPGAHDAPFPPMPGLTVTATWRDPLDAPTTVWILLSDTACGFTGACNPARVLSAEAPAGATTVDLRLEQVHAGDYFLNVILDRNGNFTRRLFPDRGDGIAGLDAAVSVPAAGELTVERAISITVP